MQYFKTFDLFSEALDLKAKPFMVKKIDPFHYKIQTKDPNVPHKSGEYFEFDVKFLPTTGEFGTKTTFTGHEVPKTDSSSIETATVKFPGKEGEDLKSYNIVLEKIKGDSIGPYLFGLMSSLKDIVLSFVKDHKPIALIFMVMRDLFKDTSEKDKKTFKLFNEYISKNILKQLKNKYGYYIVDKLFAGYIVSNKYYDSFYSTLEGDETKLKKY